MAAKRIAQQNCYYFVLLCNMKRLQIVFYLYK